jgi:uncharacterized integral membrane protein
MFKLILWIILLLLVVFFVVFNVEPKVTVHLLPGVALENIPLALVIIVSFVLGLLFGLSFSLVQMLKRSLRKGSQDEPKQDKQNISTL